jgi:hypothetical protein
MSGPLDQVPAVVERVRRELVLARFLGKLAVDQGIREARLRVESLITSAVARPPQDATEAAGVEVVAPSRTPPARGSVAGTEHADPDGADSRQDPARLDAESLALPGYDHLSASDIVAKLAGLDPDERAAIESYERTHRGRRTVLGRLDQLKAQDPR